MLYLSCLPADMVSSVLLHFSTEELLDVIARFETNPIFQELLNSQTIWTEIWKHNVSTIVKPTGNICQKYKTLCKDIEKINTKLSQISYLAMVGYDVMLYKIADNLEMRNYALGQTMANGFKQIAERLIQLGVDNYDELLINAAYNGYEDLVELAVERGATGYNNAIPWAAMKGHVRIVDRMLQLGANDYNITLVMAGHAGHKDIVDKMLRLGANNYADAMASIGNTEIVELIKSYRDKHRN
jgi:hypothetical protein